jgi:signal transduction histidine kinase
MMGDKKQQKPLRAGHRRLGWRSPLLGYPFAVLFAAAAFLIPVIQRVLGIQDPFIEPPFVITVLLVGWFWGIGPVLLALLLEVLALDYWIVPPVGVINFFFQRDGIVAFTSFILLQLTVLALVITQKNYRQQLLHAKQAASQYAEELAESNARLQQADRVKDQFLSMASHELKTPVANIQLSVQWLQHRLKRQSTQNPEQLVVYDALEKVERQGRRLTDLINDLLDINTLRSGKIPVRLASCDLRCLCQQILGGQQSLTGRSIDLRLPADPVIVQVDYRRLAQVVNNLVTNALKYSPANTPIGVEISQRPEEALLAVSNQGPVLSKEQQENLFEPFYRSPEARSSATPGWGLGLAICKEIVLQHNGRIWVESSEEKGTIFFVALPLPTSDEKS